MKNIRIRFYHPLDSIRLILPSSNDGQSCALKTFFASKT